MPSVSLSFLAFLLIIITIIILVKEPYSSHAIEHERREESKNKLISLGAIIEYDSRAGREEKVAMQIAIEDFCAKSSQYYCPTLLVNDSRGDPVHAALLGK